MGCASPGVTTAFSGGQSSFPTAFLLAEPLETTLGADEGAPSFPLALLSSSFLRVAITLTLCLAASISTKVKMTGVKKIDDENKTDGRS